MDIKKVFISYSRKDYLDESNSPRANSEVAKIIYVLEENEIEYWIDVHAHYSTEYFTEVIANKIDWCDCVIFISSNFSNDSIWVNKEILYALDKKKKILPVKIDNYSFSKKISLALAGIDYIEYYRNSNDALQRIIDNLKPGNVIIPIEKKWKVLFKIIFIFLIILFSCYLLFFSVGCFSGFFSNRNSNKDVDFKANEISIIDKQHIRFCGEYSSFTYDINKKHLQADYLSTYDFKHLTFEQCAMAVSFPLAFEKLVKTTKYAGSGKTKVVYFVGGAIGILLGYSQGYAIGKDYATYKNEEDLKKYFFQPSVQDNLKQRINMLYEK